MLGFSSRANWRNCCTARCWSIWYRLFIATLSFSWQKKPPSAHYDRGCESRYFLRINGHPPFSRQSPKIPPTLWLMTVWLIATVYLHTTVLLTRRKVIRERGRPR